MKIRTCQNCGATVQLATEALSTRCAFCDSPLVESESAAEPVDRVVPFLLERSQAASRLGKHLAQQWLAPEPIRRAARPDELRPAFVPFYAYDALTRTGWSAGIGIYWHRQETYTTTENGKTVTKTRTVRETEWHDLDGTHAGQWFDHLVSASQGLPEDEANALEPFDLGRSKPFAAALVAGIDAELPTLDHGAAQATAQRELHERAEAAIAAEHLPGDTHRSLQCQTDLQLEAVRLVLLPVWIAGVDTPRGRLRLLVNGQTGEVVGAVPVSVPKVVGLVAGGLLFVLGGIALVAALGGWG